MVNNMSKQQEAKRQQVMSQAFVALSALQACRRVSPPPRVMVNDLIQYIIGGGHIDVARIEQAINTELATYRRFQQLLAVQRQAWLPREACAQDVGELTQRQGNEFVLKFKRSKGDPQQVYVILEWNESQPVLVGEELYLHISTQAREEEQQQAASVSNQNWRLTFPPLTDGRSQVILTDEDPRLLAMRDMDSDLSLISR